MCIYYLQETQKNGVYVNYPPSESSVKNLQKGETVNNSRQEHHSVTHFLQVVCSLLVSWMLELQDCTGQAESNVLVQACLSCNNACERSHAKVKPLRHTCPKAFNIQAECQFKDLRNTVQTEKKKWIMFSIQYPLILCSAWKIFLEMNLIKMTFSKVHQLQRWTEAWGGLLALCLYHSATYHLCHFYSGSLAVRQPAPKNSWAESIHLPV